MKSSMTKARIFTLIALGIMLYWFVVPSVFTHNVVELSGEGKADAIPAVSYRVWNHYTKGRYVSPAAPKEAVGDLKKMIDEAAELSVVSAPVWYVALEAPNYPKETFPEGIPVFYHFDGFSGDVHEMNTINHYIGMDPMERGAPYLRVLAPYALVAVALLMVFYLLYDSKLLDMLMLVPVVLPVVFLSLYAYWLYWFGHHMHDWGAFKIKPFTPTVFGDGKVAQFTTHSYPTIGFWLLLIVAALSLLSILSKRKARRLGEEEV